MFLKAECYALNYYSENKDSDKLRQHTKKCLEGKLDNKLKNKLFSEAKRRNF